MADSNWGLDVASLRMYRGLGVVDFAEVVVDKNERQGNKTATMTDDDGGLRKTKLKRDKERQSCDSQCECWIISLYFVLFVAFVWLVLVILRKVGSGVQATMWCAHDGMAGWDVLFVVDCVQRCLRSIKVNRGIQWCIDAE